MSLILNGALISLHTRSVWETTCDALPHSSYQNFWFKIPWVPPLKYFRNVGLDNPPPHENLVRTCYLGFELFWSTPPPMKIWPDWGTLDLSWAGVPPPPWKYLCGSWYVETNHCILQRYKDNVLFYHGMRMRCPGFWRSNRHNFL